MAVKLLDEIDPLERLALVDMSYSRLSTFDMCPAKYFYSYVAKEERVFAEHAVLGNVIHKTLENILEPGEHIDLALLIAEYSEQLTAWDPDGLISDHLVVAGKTMLEEFVDRHADETFAINEKEKAFEIVVGGALLRGYIDRVDIEGDTVYVVDYKSGKREVTFDGAKSDLQLNIYAMAMAREFPDKKIHASLYYLRTGRRKGHLFTPQELEQAEHRVIDLVLDVLRRDNFPHTKDTKMCSFCDHRKSGACRYGTRVNIRNNWSK